MTAALSLKKPKHHFDLEGNEECVGIKDALKSLSALRRTSLLTPHTTKLGSLTKREIALLPSQIYSKGYAESFVDGLIAGVKGVGHVLAHPIDTLIVPPAEFVADFAVLGAKGYLDALEKSRPGVKLHMSVATAQKAKKRMKNRVDSALALKEALSSGSGPQRVEIATAIATSVILGQRAISTAALVIKMPISRISMRSSSDPVLSKVLSELRSLPERIDDMAFYTLAEKAEVTSSLVVSQIAKVADKTSVPLSRRVDLVSFKEGKRQIEIVKKRTDSELALSEICHLDHLANTRIYSNVPKVIGIDILRGSQWDLYLSKAPGIAMSDLVKQANLTQLERGFFRLGQALGEMDIKECGPLDSFELKVISKLPERYQFVQKSLQEEYNLRLPLSHKEIVEITRHFKSTSSRAFLSHDDPSLGNFMWDSKTNQITVFDIGTIDVTSGSKFIQNPRGYAFYNLLLEIDEEMAANPARSLSIKKAYIKGYEEISGLSFREDEYMRIYTLIEKITGALDNEVSKQEMQSILRSLSTPLA